MSCRGICHSQQKRVFRYTDYLPALVALENQCFCQVCSRHGANLHSDGQLVGLLDPDNSGTPSMRWSETAFHAPLIHTLALVLVVVSR